MKSFAQFKVLTFDCYGTLIDWERGLCVALRPWLDASGCRIDDEALLAAYAEVESVIQRQSPESPYPEVLRIIHRRLAENLGIPSDAGAADTFASSIGDWPAFSDSAAALNRLKERYRLVILSNIDRASFALSNQLLGIEFDAIITAEDVGSYKPAMGHFTRAAELIRSWGIKKSDWMHVAQSLYHDHVPAKSLGLATAWIDRRRGKIGTGATPTVTLPSPPDWTMATLGAFADEVEKAFKA